MKTGEKTEYDGWIVETYCREAKPDDWAPGDPIPYKANLIAEARRLPQPPSGSVGARRFTIPEHGEREFAEWPEAFRALKSEAHARIDSFKQG